MNQEHNIPPDLISKRIKFLDKSLFKILLVLIPHSQHSSHLERNRLFRVHKLSQIFKIFTDRRLHNRNPRSNTPLWAHRHLIRAIIDRFENV
ncbi:hypothetical protein HanPI659440_Chr00c09g0721101 [Helianthus annuus]|nr:hypothetical protein HanPI659440_Chr00c09g0721101 [Helianthus annuus]